MPQSYKVLGQSSPASGTLTTLYTAPTQAIVSTVTICNQNSTATTYRIAVRPSGASITTSQWLVYDSPLPANDSVVLTMGIALAATDILSVQAGAASVSFSAFGVEIS
jgi:hypothetical protein